MLHQSICLIVVDYWWGTCLRGYWDRTTDIGKSVLRVREQIYKIAVELWPRVVLKRGPPSLEELGDWVDEISSDFFVENLKFEVFARGSDCIGDNACSWGFQTLSVAVGTWHTQELRLFNVNHANRKCKYPKIAEHFQVCTSFDWHELTRLIEYNEFWVCNHDCRTCGWCLQISVIFHAQKDRVNEDGSDPPDLAVQLDRRDAARSFWVFGYLDLLILLFSYFPIGSMRMLGCDLVPVP